MSADAGSRRLAAILPADVVGYSRLIGADELGTLTKRVAVRSGVIDPQVATHIGRVVKTSGDGLLAEFASAVQVVQCAIAIQQAMRVQEGIELRIGLHSADVTVQPDDDLLGEGVNVAARLEALAEPGGICISARVREDATGKLALEVAELSRDRTLFVIARNPSFTYRGRLIDIKQVGRELGVRYVGQRPTRGQTHSSGRAADRRHDRQPHLGGSYDHEVEQVFAVQDEIAEAVSTAIRPAVGLCRTASRTA